jgi:hypothetical protein
MTTDHDAYSRLLAFVERLDASRVWYRLAHIRPDAIMVLVATPGVYWEVEFMTDGTVEVERFRSAGALEGEAALDELFEEYLA